MERNPGHLNEKNAIYFVGRLGAGLVATETSSILQLYSSSDITSVPSARRHIVGVLPRGRDIIPVVDLAIDRPKGFSFKRPMAIVVSLDTGDGYVGLYLDSAEGIMEDGKVQLESGDKSYLRQLVWYEGCFHAKMAMAVKGMIVPIIDAKKLNEVVKIVVQCNEKVDA